MRSTLWILDPTLPRERVEALLGGLAVRGLAASLRELPEGPVVEIPDPPEGLETPPGVLRSSRVDIPSSSAVTRRTFLDSFASAMAAGTAGTAAVLAGLYAAPPPPRPGDEPEEMDVGSAVEIEALGAKTFRFGRDPCVVVATGGRFHALSTVCSHLGCLVAWVPASRQLDCPCHRASFDLEGNVLQGPPPRPLRTFLVRVAGERVVVRRRTAP